MLCRETDKQAIIFLKDVRYDDMKAVVDFMYRGEVHVPQEQLQTFLSTAKALQIKGLAFRDDNGDSATTTTTAASNSTGHAPASSVKAPPKLTQAVKKLDSPVSRMVQKKGIKSRASLPLPRTTSSPMNRAPVKQKNEVKPFEAKSEPDHPDTHLVEINTDMDIDTLTKASDENLKVIFKKMRV